MAVCLICGERLPAGDDREVHGDCLTRLWDRDAPPRVPWTRQTLAEQVDTPDSSSISGYQSKALVRVDASGALEVPNTGSTHILKPQTDRLKHMPENEHLTMRLAALAGLEVPPCGLVRLVDGSLAYVVRRFDRVQGDPPRRLQKLDFCQWLDVLPERMYDEPSEACARALQERADALSDPQGTLVRLFRLFVAAYWVGNGDLHLKNISLLEDPADPRKYRLAPTYDFLCTAIYGSQHRSMALTIGGRKIELRRRHFVELATSAFSMSADDACEVIDAVVAQEASAADFVGRSALPVKTQREFRRILETRAASLRDERP